MHIKERSIQILDTWFQNPDDALQTQRQLFKRAIKALLAGNVRSAHVPLHAKVFRVLYMARHLLPACLRSQTSSELNHLRSYRTSCLLFRQIYNLLWVSMPSVVANARSGSTKLGACLRMKFKRHMHMQSCSQLVSAMCFLYS
jgi:hypothetical protein